MFHSILECGLSATVESETFKKQPGLPPRTFANCGKLSVQLYKFSVDGSENPRVFPRMCFGATKMATDEYAN